MKQGAIFDMDGLLFDTERLYRDSWEVIAQEFGLKHDPAFPKAVCGTSGAHMLEVIHQHYPTVDTKRFAESCIQRVRTITQTNVPVKSGAQEILQFLHTNGVKIAVASSSPKDAIVHHLKLTGLEPYFDAVVSGQDVKHGKPEPDIFLLAADILQLPAQECYVFEDGINGVKAGIAAGCPTVMIPDLTPPTEKCRQQCAGIFPDLLRARDAIADGSLL